MPIAKSTAADGPPLRRFVLASRRPATPLNRTWPTCPTVHICGIRPSYPIRRTHRSHPTWRPPATFPSAIRNPLQYSDCLSDPLLFLAQLNKHFVDVHLFRE